MILEHIKNNWESHFASVSAGGLSLVSGGAIAQSIIVGVCVYLITNVIKWLVVRLWAKTKCGK